MSQEAGSAAETKQSQSHIWHGRSVNARRQMRVCLDGCAVLNRAGNALGSLVLASLL